MHLTMSVLAALLLFVMPLQAADETVTVEEEFVLEEEIPEDDASDFFRGRDSDIFAAAGDVFASE